MKVKFHSLPSADRSAWKDGMSSADSLPIRDSGSWIDTKHKLLTYYGHLFATGMKKQSALTKFLGNDSWKQIPRHNPREFFRGVLEIYKKQLDWLGFSYVGQEVISNDQNTPLYLLLFASKHPKYPCGSGAQSTRPIPAARRELTPSRAL